MTDHVPLRILPPALRLPLAPESRPMDRALRPHYAVWEVTLRCDLACQHCSSRAGRPRDDELTTAEALDTARQLAELGVTEVTLIGGEAYLREDWLAIIREIRARGMKCTMVTGGRGFSSERAIQAREAGLQSISVSVDGLEESHDRLRALKGSFAAALRAIENGHQAGLQVTANTQIGGWNLRDVPPLLERLIDAGIAAWQVQFTVAMGRAADHPELLMEPYQMLEAIPMLARLKSRADEAGVTLWPGNNVGYFGPHEASLREALPACHRGSCGAGRVSIGLESNGDVKGCPSLPSADYVGGNIRQHTLQELWERAPALRFMRDRTRADLWGHCATCYYAEECLGGCSWTADAILGRPGNNPYCHHRALTLLRAGRRERVVRRRAPPGASFDRGEFEVLEEPWPLEEIEGARAVARLAKHWLAES